MDRIVTSTPEASPVTRDLIGSMGQMTMDRIGSMSLENARRNLAWLGHGKSLAELPSVKVGEGDSAIVIAAGPSIKRTEPLKRIVEYGYKGALIATESAMRYTLSQGVVPDLVVTLDPHSSRIVRWFGDPDLNMEELEKDDYYRRQDYDESFANELAANKEVIDLVNRYGPKIRIALATTASEAVVRRAVQSGMQIYWWNPMLDDPSDENSLTRDLYEMNKLPCMNAGGNVGTACWMMADAVLGKAHVALTGIDFGYYADTPYDRTQYYWEIINLVGKDRLDEMFTWVENPALGQQFYMDPTYMWYRACMLEMVGQAECTTYNCTEGGTLFGDGIDFIGLDGFLKRFS